MRAIGAGLLLLAAGAGAGETWYFRVDRPGMIPAAVTGVLDLREDGGTWTFTELDGWVDVPLADVKTKGKKVSFAVAHPQWRLTVEAEVGKEGLAGTCAWPPRKYDFRASREVPRFDGKAPRDAAACAGLDPLIVSAEAMDSDVLVVLKDSRVACERHFGGGKPRPHYLMSVTKSIAVLAVPFLIEEKKIASLDAPLSTWFPEWKEGMKAKVTLRHVLTHTSGLENDPKAHTLNAAKDGVRFARESPVTVEPGTVFSYNNRAVALLAGIVKEASGEPIDRYLEKRLFAPLGIRAQWHKDPAGNVRTYADLRMGARDLAKIGQLMLDGGKPLPEGWAAKLTEPSAIEKSCGLLWWILYDEKGERIGFHANGDLGQILAVYPKSRVVGVRLRDPPPSADPTEERFFSFGRFYGFLSRLTP